ncbi:MAG: hypothetical protein DWQ07_25305 [Chloroflexi bacterium]|nr:MAG: hypothetical protein DWQ07_25305 [Chloroflexota bacterium]MBL1196146.1 FtsX-like permease family protein [Chloroflexota bacterium]NOH13439.1 FtsX-like permease family protein [Chloroflexota bacterium]
MAIPSRWRKLLNDLWGNKSRTLLVVLSIAIGVGAVGMISNSHVMMERDLYSQFERANPHSIIFYISPYPEELATSIAGNRDIQQAQPWRTTSAQVLTADGGKSGIELNTAPDFENIEVNRFECEVGCGVPGDRQIVLERLTAEVLGVGVGDTVTIEMPDEKQYELAVIGIVHDLTKVPPTLFNQLYAYVDMSTLRWMGEASYYNRLDVIMAEKADQTEHVRQVAEDLRVEVIEPSGYQVATTSFGFIASSPRAYWAEDQIQGILVIFNVMSVLCMLLSAGLVINTISAILTQQVQQIGIMRSIGAKRSQIIQMYVVSVVVFSVLALIVALPLGLLGAWGIASFMASYLNYDLTAVNLPISIVLLQVGLGFLIPLAAGLFPILSGTRISIYDAIYQHGISGSGRRGTLDQLLKQVRAMTRPLAMSLRNTFRKKARLAFTLITLTLSGAMFISVFSTRSSLQGQLDEMTRYSEFDVSIALDPGIKAQSAVREALRLPGVDYAEVWYSANGVIIYEDGSEGTPVLFRSTEDEGITVDPRIMAGRWLETTDRLQVVVSEDLIDDEPDVKLGSVLEISVDGISKDYEVVGIVSRHISLPTIYMNYRQFEKVSGPFTQGSEVRVRSSVTSLGTREQQEATAEVLEQHFKDSYLSSSTAQTRADLLDNISNAFDVVLIFLVIMATLLAIVGGLGLAGTMSMNVLERTREIGVLRAVGASNQAVRQVVLVEGVIVGVTSWLFGAVLSIPFGLGLSNAVGLAIFSSTVPYHYSLAGMVTWLGLAMVIGAIASIAPARRASNLTVREVLAYE